MVDTASNLKYMDGAAVATTLQQEPIDQESQIFVRTCNRTIVLDVNVRSDSVEEVKRVIEEREGIPVTEQHLILGGKPLRHGTFLRDYDALGHQSTINVFPRIRGGNRTGDMALSSLVRVLTGHMTCEDRIPGKQPQDETVVRVLTKVGRRILHGVLTCILSAHRAGQAFNGAFGMEDDDGNLNQLRVHVYEGATAEYPRVVSRVYVHKLSSSSPPPPPLVPLDGESQKADYVVLKQVIQAMFPLDTLHVGSIYELLEVLTGEDDDIFNDDPVKRSTHLLQAYAVMVSSPVAVSTMCLNLKRFYEQLHGDRKPIFADAMRAAQETTRLADELEIQPLFENVYYYVPPSQNNDNTSAGTGGNNVIVNQYAGDTTGMEMFNFARNWFAHQPNHRWDEDTEYFKGLPHLDYIFTHHFPNFIPEVLLQLYKKFDDYNLLTSVLVPLA